MRKNIIFGCDECVILFKFSDTDEAYIIFSNDRGRSFVFSTEFEAEWCVQAIKDVPFFSGKDLIIEYVTNLGEPEYFMLEQETLKYGKVIYWGQSDLLKILS